MLRAQRMDHVPGEEYRPDDQRDDDTACTEPRASGLRQGVDHGREAWGKQEDAEHVQGWRLARERRVGRYHNDRQPRLAAPQACEY